MIQSLLVSFLSFFASATGALPENTSVKSDSTANQEISYLSDEVIQKHRTYLSQKSANNEKVLEMYDSVSYQLQQNGTSEADLQMILSAVLYAADKHNGQTRKDAAKTPYIVHPIGVANIILSEAGIYDKDIIIAAILHDTLEDSDATHDQIASLYGVKVANIVQELTNDPNLSTADNKQRQVDKAPNMTPEAKLVKLADRLYNIRDLRDPPPAWTAMAIA